jgi:hypothetical protein
MNTRMSTLLRKPGQDDCVKSNEGGVAPVSGHYRLKPFVSNCRASELPRHVLRAIVDGLQLAK